MRSLFDSLIAVVLIVSLSGCLGTFVRTPAESDPRTEQVTTRVHILAAPRRIEARMCERGLAKINTQVPLWGIAVGILTLGIIVPITTSLSCARPTTAETDD